MIELVAPIHPRALAAPGAVALPAALAVASLWLARRALKHHFTSPRTRAARRERRDPAPYANEGKEVRG